MPRPRLISRYVPRPPPASSRSVAVRHGLAPHGVALSIRERVARVYLSGEHVVSVRTRLGTTGGGPTA